MGDATRKQADSKTSVTSHSSSDLSEERGGENLKTWRHTWRKDETGHIGFKRRAGLKK